MKMTNSASNVRLLPEQVSVAKWVCIDSADRAAVHVRPCVIAPVVVSLIAAMLTGEMALAQSPTPGGRRRLPPGQVIERKLPRVDIPANTIEIRKQAPLSYKPFPIVEPGTGQPIPPDTILTLPDGKKVKAEEYYAELNKIE